MKIQHSEAYNIARDAFRDHMEEIAQSVKQRTRQIFITPLELWEIFRNTSAEMFKAETRQPVKWQESLVFTGIDTEAVSLEHHNQIDIPSI